MFRSSITWNNWSSDVFRNERRKWMRKVRNGIQLFSSNWMFHLQKKKSRMKSSLKLWFLITKDPLQRFNRLFPLFLLQQIRSKDEFQYFLDPWIPLITVRRKERWMSEYLHHPKWFQWQKCRRRRLVTCPEESSEQSDGCCASIWRAFPPSKILLSLHVVQDEKLQLSILPFLWLIQSTVSTL